MNVSKYLVPWYYLFIVTIDSVPASVLRDSTNQLGFKQQKVIATAGFSAAAAGCNPAFW